MLELFLLQSSQNPQGLVGHVTIHLIVSIEASAKDRHGFSSVERDCVNGEGREWFWNGCLHGKKQGLPGRFGIVPKIVKLIEGLPVFLEHLSARDEAEMFCVLVEFCFERSVHCYKQFNTSINIIFYELSLSHAAGVHSV
jgi:hypothetical protein